jgi:Ca-activated chloride channel family protein
VTARLSHPVVHAGRPAEIFLRIDVTGLGETSKRPPLDLAVVLDRSGSMAGEKIVFARKAVDTLIDRLVPTDHMALVAYDNVAETVFARRRVDDALVMKTKAAQIEPRGMTNLSGGLLAGLQQLGCRAGDLRRVLILSDGLANEGIVDPAGLGDIAQQAVARGRGVSTFGVGLDFNEDLLRHIADEGGGNYYYIASPDDIPNIFLEELGELGDVVAQNLTVDFRPRGAEVLGVLGFGDSGLPAQAGAVRAGAVRSVMLALGVPAIGRGGRGDGRHHVMGGPAWAAGYGDSTATGRTGTDNEVILGEVVCRWTMLDDAATTREKRITVAAVASDDLRRVEAAVDEDVLRAARLQLVADENLAATRAARDRDEAAYHRHVGRARQALERLGDDATPEVQELRLLTAELGASSPAALGMNAEIQKRAHFAQYQRRQGRPPREPKEE